MSKRTVVKLCVYFFEKRTSMITITDDTVYYHVKNFVDCKPQLYMCRSRTKDLFLSYQVTDVRYRNLLQKMKNLQKIFTPSPDTGIFYCGMHKDEEGKINVNLGDYCCLYAFACNCSLYKKSGYTFQINTKLLRETEEDNIFGTVYQDPEWRPFKKLLADDEFCNM
jgi:hypothetical protein